MPSYVRAGIRKCARIRALSTEILDSLIGKNIFGIVSRNMRGKCRFGYCAMISLLVRSIGFSKRRVALSVEILRVALLLYIRILTVMGKRLLLYSLTRYTGE